MSVGPLVEKNNIVSNDHERTHKCDFSVSDRKYPFLANLDKNIKIVRLSWNLVPRLIRISRIQWWCSLFPFFRFWLEIPFLGKLGPKNKIISLNWNLVPRLIRICRVQWWCSPFPFLTGNNLFGQNWSKKSKLSVLILSNQNYQTITNSNIHNSMMTFFCFRQEFHFLGKLGPKNKNCQFKLKNY